MTIIQADRDAVEAFHSASFTAIFNDGGDKQTVGGNMNKAHTLLLEAFAAHRAAAEVRARLEGAKEMQARRKYPVLGTQGQAKVDWQFVEDHAKQAYENHRQTVERLAERGGLSWSELCAVVQDRKWSKMETADAIEQVRAAEARYLAALDPTQIAGGGK